MGLSFQEMGGTIELEHFVTIFNCLEDMVFLIEIEQADSFRCVEVNPAYIKATGLPMHAVKNKRIEEIFSAHEAESVINNYQKAIFQSKKLTYEETLVLNGHEKTFETTITPIFSEDHQHCRYILGVSRDISERKKYESVLLEAKSELQKILTQQQGLIIKAIKHGEDFIFTLCDGQLINQFGFLPENIVEKRPQDIFSDKIAKKMIKHFELCWESGKKVTFEYSDRMHGNEIYWLTVVSPIIENDLTTSLIVYSIDIIEQKKSEESLMQTEKLALIGELAAGIGHELRNPLTSIKGFIKFMRENKEAIKDEFLDVIDTEIESLNHIASELMILAKPQAQNFISLNMIQLLDEVVFLLEPEAFRQGVKIIKNYHDDHVPGYGEKYQLKQVLINLIKNAMDAIDGQPEGIVSIECINNEDGTLVTISDNGNGIPKEVLDKMGEPFFTTKEKGTGLGLLVSYRIIKNHGGSIECLSEDGKGTSFNIWFPLCSQ